MPDFRDPTRVQARYRRNRSGRRRPPAGARRARATSAAISTCTRPRATAATAREMVQTAATRSATSTSRSPIIRSAPARRARWRATTSRGSATRSTRLRERFPGIDDPARRRGRHHARRPSRLRRRVLERFDIVLASLHDRARPRRRAAHASAISRAIEHPLVNVITHPANRLVGHSRRLRPRLRPRSSRRRPRPGRRSRSTARPAISIWTASARARRAAAGVTVTIDSDCHRPAARRQMRFGVGTARRGWVERATS